MDQEGPGNPLQSEEAYFNGSYLWFPGYKTLALFVHLPVMWCNLTIATKEVKVKLQVKLASSGNYWMGFWARL